MPVPLLRSRTLRAGSLLLGAAVVLTVGSRAAPATAVDTLGTIPVGTAPLGVAVSPSGDAVYVANSGSDSVSVIDPATNAVTATVPVGDLPTQIAVGTTRAYVTNRGDDTVSVIDRATSTVVEVLTGFSEPTGIALTSDDATVVVANSGGDEVTLYRTAGGTSQAVTVGLAPTDVAVDPAGTRAWVITQTEMVVVDLTSLATATLYPTTGAASVVVTQSPQLLDLAVTDAIAGGRNLLQGGAEIGGLVTAGPASDDATRVAVTPGTRIAYLTQSARDVVSVFESNAYAGSIAVGDQPGYLAVSPRDGRVYVANAAANTVSVLSGYTALTPSYQAVSATASSPLTPTAALTPLGLFGAVTYAVSPALPAGLSIDPATGVISGTPTVLVDADFTITATGAISGTATAGLTLTVVSPSLPPTG